MEPWMIWMASALATVKHRFCVFFDVYKQPGEIRQVASSCLPQSEFPQHPQDFLHYLPHWLTLENRPGSMRVDVFSLQAELLVFAAWIPVPRSPLSPQQHRLLHSRRWACRLLSSLKWNPSWDESDGLDRESFGKELEVMLQEKEDLGGLTESYTVCRTILDLPWRKEKCDLTLLAKH